MLNNVTPDPTTNRLLDAGYAYDAAGNMTNDGANSLTYDAENRVLTAAGASYTYDGKSLRVKKVSGSTTTVYVFSGTKVIAEYDNGALPASPSREYIYTGSQLTAKIEAGATTYFHADHLSARLVTDSTGTVTGQQGHFPYGESWYGSSVTKWKFTTYERDTESGNDYAMFRTHVNRLGRFSSPDPLAGSISDPQSLNRYAYTLNDPANLVDPLGLSWHNPAYACADGSAEGVDCNFWTDMGSGFSCFDTLDTVGVGEGRETVPAIVCEIQTPGLQVGPPQRPRGRRGAKKPKFDCTLNFFIGSNFLLGAAGQQAMLSELNRIFNDAGVGVNVVGSPTAADFSIGLGIASSSNTSAGGDNLQGTSFGTVYLGTLLSVNPGATQSQLGTAAGLVGAHEFGHFVYPGQSDLDPNKGLNQWDILKGFADPFNERLTFRTDAAKRDVLNKCKSLHKAQ